MFKKSTITLLFIASFSHAVFAEQKFLCKTQKLTAMVDLTAGKYSYKVWNGKKALTKTPDLIVSGGEETVEGTGACGHFSWTFKNGTAQYVVNSPVGCTESTPPKNAIGELDVWINEKIVTTLWCEK